MLDGPEVAFKVPSSPRWCAHGMHFIQQVPCAVFMAVCSLLVNARCPTMLHIVGHLPLLGTAWGPRTKCLHSNQTVVHERGDDGVHPHRENWMVVLEVKSIERTGWQCLGYNSLRKLDGGAWGKSLRKAADAAREHFLVQELVNVLNISLAHWATR